MTTALVFAGSSFIGRSICAALRNEKVRVVSTSRIARTGLDTLRCDLQNACEVERAIVKVRPDWIVQCAGATAASDPREMNALHVRGTLAVLSATARQVPDARVVLFGSAAEYGAVSPMHFPIGEDYPPAPQTSFAASKLAQTNLAADFAREHRIRVVTVRPFNVLGPGLPKHYFAAALAWRLLSQLAEGNREPFAVANAQATRDFVDVRDVADAVLRLLRLPTLPVDWMPIYNIASNVETPLIDVALELGRLAGGLAPTDGGAEMSRGGAVRSCGDGSRLRRDTGWATTRSWLNSIADQWTDMLSSVRLAG